MQKITTYLWFDTQAEEAADFYVSIFKDSRIVSASSMMVVFELAGQRYMALNGGPMFTFTEAISLYVNCESQEEVDEYWNALSQGGSEGRCGWLKDKYGLSWQVVPELLGRLMGSPDQSKAKATMDAMLQMGKLDMNALQDAYDTA